MLTATKLFLTAPTEVSPAPAFVTRDPDTGNLMHLGQRFRFGGPNTSTIGLTAAAPGAAYGATVDGNGNHLPSHTEIDDILDQVDDFNGNVIRPWPAVMSIGRTNAVQPTLGSFNAAALAPIDYLLQQCALRGIRCIFPLVDNYNFPGTGGRITYCTLNGVSTSGDQPLFYTNATVVNSFKAHINFVLSHVNSITGVAYKDDPTILAWETGNELTAGGVSAAAYAAWVGDIATYVKVTCGAQQLFMDGSYGFGEPQSALLLALPSVDMYGNHAYGDFRPPAVLEKEAAIAHAWGKAYYVGEYDWRGTATTWGLPEFISQCSASKYIDGTAAWGVIATLHNTDAFSLKWPGVDANMVIRNNEMADHNLEMATRDVPGPRIVATVAGSQTGQTYRSAGFSSGIYRPEAWDLIGVFGGNNFSPGNGVIAANPAGWFNPLGSGVGVSSDTHQLGLLLHWVTPAEQEAGTVVYTALGMYTIASWGGIQGIVVRGADRDNPIAAFNTAFDNGNTTTPHILPGLTGLPDDALAVSCLVANGLATYTTPSSGWGVLGTNNGQQGLWCGVRNKLTTAGVDIAPTNITPSVGDEFAAISIAFNKAPALNQTAILPTGNVTAAMGDSITDYGGNQDYQPWVGPIYLNQLHILTSQRMKFGGVYATGGWHMSQIRDVHLPQVLALNPKPSAVILFLGTNDFGNPLQYTQNIFTDIVDRLLNAGIAPILVTIMPHDDVPSYLPYVLTWNAFIRQYAAANGFAILDAWTAVTDPDQTYKAGYTIEGLHPTEIAYRAIADQGIADGLPTLFPAAPTDLVSNDINDLTNLFNNGVINQGLLSVDTNGDGVADAFTTKSTTGIFTRIARSLGFWQQLKHSTTGQAIFLQRTLTGFSPGNKYRFAMEVETDNISLTATAFTLELRATVPGGFTYPTGASSTDIRLGAQVWTADTAGIFYVDFVMPPGTTALVYTAGLNPITGGEDPALRIALPTVSRIDIVPSLYPPVNRRSRPNYGALIQS